MRSSITQQQCLRKSLLYPAELRPWRNRELKEAQLGCSTPLFARLRNGGGNDAKRQYQFQRIVEQSQRPETFVPFNGTRIPGVDGERHAPDRRGNGQSPLARGQHQFATQPAPLHRETHRQASQSKDRHFIVAEPFGELGGDTGKLDCTRAYRIIAQDACWLTRRHRNEGLGAARLVILPRKAGEIIVELRRTAIETLEGVSAA